MPTAPTYTVEGEPLTSREIIDRARKLSRNQVSENTIRKRLLTDGRRTWSELAKSGAQALKDARVQFASSHAEFYKNDQKKRQAKAPGKKISVGGGRARYEKCQAELEELRAKCQAESTKPAALPAQATAVRTSADGGPSEG